MVKRVQSIDNKCQPEGLLFAGLILIPVSLLLQEVLKYVQRKVYYGLLVIVTPTIVGGLCKKKAIRTLKDMPCSCNDCASKAR